HAPVDRARETGGMVGTARHGIERDVVEPGDVEAPLVIGDDRLLRVTGGTADMDVVGRVERNQSGVLAAPGALDRPLDPRPPDVTGAQRDQGEAGQHDLAHAIPSTPSTLAATSWSPAAPAPGRAQRAPPP